MSARDGTGASFGIVLSRPRAVDELVREYGGVVDDSLGVRVVDRLVAPEHATTDRDLVVVTSARRAAAAIETLGVLLCQRDVAARCPDGRRWTHDHATWVVASLLKDVEGERAVPGIHPAAFVDEAAEIDVTATVLRGAVVHAGASVGAGTVIGEGAVVYGRTRIAERVTVGPLAVIGRPGFGWAARPDGALIRIPQLGGVVVESDVEIGALVTIDAGTLSPTILRRRVKLDAHVHVAHNVVIDEGTIVAAQAGFAGSVHVGAGVLVGGQAGVTDHANIGKGARIAAKSGVIGDVAPGTVVAGFPAIPRMEWLRAWARLLGRRKRDNQ